MEGNDFDPGALPEVPDGAAADNAPTTGADDADPEDMTMSSAEEGYMDDASPAPSDLDDAVTAPPADDTTDEAEPSVREAPVAAAAGKVATDEALTEEPAADAAAEPAEVIEQESEPAVEDGPTDGLGQSPAEARPNTGEADESPAVGQTAGSIAVAEALEPSEITDPGHIPEPRQPAEQPAEAPGPAEVPPANPESGPQGPEYNNAPGQNLDIIRTVMQDPTTRDKAMAALTKDQQKMIPALTDKGLKTHADIATSLGRSAPALSQAISHIVGRLKASSEPIVPAHLAQPQGAIKNPERPAGLPSLVHTLRERSGLTLKEAAARTDSSPSLISRLEAGAHVPQSPSLIAIIAKELNATADEKAAMLAAYWEARGGQKPSAR